jgi:hypothetical protein
LKFGLVSENCGDEGALHVDLAVEEHVDLVVFDVFEVEQHGQLALAVDPDAFRFLVDGVPLFTVDVVVSQSD